MNMKNQDIETLKVVYESIISDLIELHMDKEQGERLLENLYDLRLKNHIGKGRKKEELLDYYKSVALDTKQDIIKRTTGTLCFLALQQHLEKKRAEENTSNNQCKFCGHALHR